MTEENKLKWYVVSPVQALDVPKVLEKLKTATADEPAAVIREDSRKNNMLVKTVLSWDFLRELTPESIVAITHQLKGE